MRKGLTLTIVIAALVVILFLANSFSLTGNAIIPNVDSIQYGGYSCVDDDGARGPDSIYTKSATTSKLIEGDYSRTEEDECFSGHAVNEATCTRKARIKYIRVDCEGSCIDGACVR